MILSKMKIALLTAISVLFTNEKLALGQPQALVYRGRASCKGCPEAVANLLKSSSWSFNTTFAGDNEDTPINEEELGHVDVFAFGGGQSLDGAWREMKQHDDAIRQFVSNGGHYMGFCLGAYLAGSTPGFGLVPPGVNVVSERNQPRTQANTTKDTIVQVDWTFSITNETEMGRWVYFQDGAVITGLNSTQEVLGRYSSNDDVAAVVTRFGRGSVGVCGVHPEATEDWYSQYGLENPDGIKFDIGHDFIDATMKGGGGGGGGGNATSGGGDASSAGPMMQNPLRQLIRAIW